MQLLYGMSYPYSVVWSVLLPVRRVWLLVNDDLRKDKVKKCISKYDGFDFEDNWRSVPLGQLRRSDGALVDAPHTKCGPGSLMKVVSPFLLFLYLSKNKSTPASFASSGFFSLCKHVLNTQNLQYMPTLQPIALLQQDLEAELERVKDLEAALKLVQNPPTVGEKRPRAVYGVGHLSRHAKTKGTL
jgi:hypothetical protein